MTTIRTPRSWLPPLILLLPMLAVMGCRSPQPPAADTREAIQSRATRQFDRVTMAKPTEASAAAFPLAPLILIENRTVGEVARLPTEVWTWTSAASWLGGTVEQVIFVWQTPGTAFQGVRLTLDDKGMPIIWEVLRDGSGMRVVYVGQSLEAEAMRQHQQPLSGHQFWIEPERSDTSVIARVLDETTVPMGPIVYLEASTGTVSTIICRCMPAQAREVTGVQSYPVRQISTNAWKSLPVSLRRAASDWSPLRPPPEMSGLFRLKSD